MLRFPFVMGVALFFSALGCGGSGDESTGLASHAQPAASCQTACDCDPGAACVNDKCVTESAMVYCCGASLCPTGDVCQERTGTMSTCAAAITSDPRDMSVADLSSSSGSGLGGLGSLIPDLAGLGGLGGSLPDLGLGGLTGTGGLQCLTMPCTKDSDCQPGCSSCNTFIGGFGGTCNP